MFSAIQFSYVKIFNKPSRKFESSLATNIFSINVLFWIIFLRSQIIWNLLLFSPPPKFYTQFSHNLKKWLVQERKYFLGVGSWAGAIWLQRAAWFCGFRKENAWEPTDLPKCERRWLSEINRTDINERAIVN